MISPEVRQRYCQKKYDNAPLIECGCGCGQWFKSVNRHGKRRKFLAGHNSKARRLYDDPKQFKREWNHRNRAKRRSIKQKCWRRRKVKLITDKGGKCGHCQILYNGKNASIFDFHHRDRADKDFSFGSSKLTNKRWDDILAEAAKCDLLCANCHRLVHSGEY